MIRRISLRWVAEVIGLAALCVAAFTISTILGWGLLGVSLVAEGNFGTPFGPKV